MPCMDFNITWKGEGILKVIKRYHNSMLKHGVRLWESEAAVEMKMTLIEWYAKPVIEREMVIATMLADKWIDVLMLQNANKSVSK